MNARGTISVSVLAGLPADAGVVLVDPPWNFVTYSPKGWKKSAHAHYSCMTVEEIAALPVQTLCAPDCVCVCWATQTHVPYALHVLTAWGFSFISMGAWAKQSKTGRRWAFGTGYRVRSAAEFFLLGACGRPKQLSRSIRNLIVAPVREHSRKPDEMYDLIERGWPGPYVELFARYRRDGWSQWGDALPERAAEPLDQGPGSASVPRANVMPIQTQYALHLALPAHACQRKQVTDLAARAEQSPRVVARLVRT
jgi:N6-adenosine-specific RNA methylase IME4